MLRTLLLDPPPTLFPRKPPPPPGSKVQHWIWSFLQLWTAGKWCSSIFSQQCCFIDCGSRWVWFWRLFACESSWVVGKWVVGNEKVIHFQLGALRSWKITCKIIRTRIKCSNLWKHFYYSLLRFPSYMKCASWIYHRKRAWNVDHHESSRVFTFELCQGFGVLGYIYSIKMYYNILRLYLADPKSEIAHWKTGSFHPHLLLF